MRNARRHRNRRGGCSREAVIDASEHLIARHLAEVAIADGSDRAVARLVKRWSTNRSTCGDAPRTTA